MLGELSFLYTNPPGPLPTAGPRDWKMQIGPRDYGSSEQTHREQFLFGRKRMNEEGAQSWEGTAQRRGEEEGWGKLAGSWAGATCNLFSRR